MRESLPFIPRTCITPGTKGTAHKYWRKEEKNAGENLLMTGATIELGMWIHDSHVVILLESSSSMHTHLNLPPHLHFESLWTLACLSTAGKCWHPTPILINVVDTHEVMSKVIAASSVLLSNRLAWTVFVCFLISDVEISRDPWLTGKRLLPNIQLFLFHKVTFLGLKFSIFTSIKGIIL